MLKRFATFLLILLLACVHAFAASSTLSNLPAGSAVSSGDLFYDVQSPGSGGVKVTAQQMATYFASGIVTPIQITTVRLTASQLENIGTTPVTIIPAQGAHTVIIVLASSYVSGTGSFSGGGSGGLYYGATTTFPADGNGVVSPTPICTGDGLVPINPSTLYVCTSLANLNPSAADGDTGNEPVEYLGNSYTGGAGNTMVLTVLWYTVPTQ